MKRLLLISNSTQHGQAYLEHCAAEIRDFLGTARRVLFVPYALHDHDAYAATAADAYGRLGCTLQSAHQSPRPAELLDGVDAVFTGGGNTFRLLKALYDLGLREPLAAKVRAGMPYIGTSAGSNIACPTIRTTNDMPIVEPPSFRALDLVPFQLNPHYLDPPSDSTHMGETRETRIREFLEENDTPVVGLREGGILRIENREMSLRGASARVFLPGGAAEEHPPGADLSGLLG